MMNTHGPVSKTTYLLDLDFTSQLFKLKFKYGSYLSEKDMVCSILTYFTFLVRKISSGPNKELQFKLHRVKVLKLGNTYPYFLYLFAIVTN